MILDVVFTTLDINRLDLNKKFTAGAIVVVVKIDDKRGVLVVK